MPCVPRTKLATLLRENARAGATVREFWQEWTTNKLWLRDAESTNMHNAERTARVREPLRPQAHARHR